MNNDPKPVGTVTPLTSVKKRRRKQVSPIIELTKLLSRTFKQPLGLPTPDQAPEMKRLILEVEKLLEYRQTHPNWRQEGQWN